MPSDKVKNLDEKEYQAFIKELVGDDEVEVLEPQKKD
jgi:hypothetical protein